MTNAIVLSVLLVTLGVAAGHTSHSGTCPKFTPAANFDVERFLGRWNVTHGFDVSSNCLTFTYTLTNGEFKVTETKEVAIANKLNIDHKYITVGTLQPIDGNYADTSATFTFNRFPSARYQIILVDRNYENAAVFHCQSWLVTHRRTIYVLTKGSESNTEFLQQVRGLMVDKMMKDSLKETKHENCRVTGDTEVEFSPDSIRNTANSFVDTVANAAGTVAGTVVEVGSEIVDRVSDSVSSDHDPNSDVELISA